MITKNSSVSPFEVLFYETENGRQPAKEFLDSLDIKTRAKLASMICLLQDNGWRLREPYSKYLSDCIFELRTTFASNALRVLYFYFDNNQIVLTNGFIKKTQKTPKRILMMAKKYREDYIKRQGKQHEQ